MARTKQTPRQFRRGRPKQYHASSSKEKLQRDEAEGDAVVQPKSTNFKNSGKTERGHPESLTDLGFGRISIDTEEFLRGMCKPCIERCVDVS